jgi:hypothetical protein
MSSRTNEPRGQAHGTNNQQGDDMYKVVNKWESDICLRAFEKKVTKGLFSHLGRKKELGQRTGDQNPRGTKGVRMKKSIEWEIEDPLNLIQT